ncbi:MAG: hypothetical protein U0002_10370 [Thermoanaerobaculia bacterium]
MPGRNPFDEEPRSLAEQESRPRAEGEEPLSSEELANVAPLLAPGDSLEALRSDARAFPHLEPRPGERLPDADEVAARFAELEARLAASDAAAPSAARVLTHPGAARAAPEAEPKPAGKAENAVDPASLWRTLAALFFLSTAGLAWWTAAHYGEPHGGATEVLQPRRLEDPLRGEPIPAAEERPAGRAETLTLVLALPKRELQPSERFQVEISVAGDAHPVWHLGDLEATPRGTIELTIPRRRLPPAKLRIRLAATAPQAEPLGTYEIDLSGR